jgi:predicted HicB family RNase H-like nuclease
MQTVDTTPSEVVRLAEELFSRRPSWVDFFREIFGWDGAVMRAFPTPDDREAFRETEEYGRLNAMLDELREEGESNAPRREPTSTITVRLPRALHESLLEEAAQSRMSLNRLCIVKLTQVLGVPGEAAGSS